MASVTITGRVGKELGTSGYEVWETINLPSGQSFEKKWAVWTTPAPASDTTIIVTGTGSWKVREYTNQNGETKHTIDASLNDVKVSGNTETTPF